MIYQAHRDAIHDRGRLRRGAERGVLPQRCRTAASRKTIRGVVAAAFDHWDSRAGDPHLHTHVVVANRAQAARTGRGAPWTPRTLFQQVVALSELHEGVLEDLLTERLGYGWDERARRHSLVPRHDVAGVPDELIEEFSQRSSQIEAAKALLVAQFARTHGRQPTTDEVLRLRQTATLTTRPDKQHRSLAEQTQQWRERARPFLAGDRGNAGDTVAWADALRDRCSLPPIRNDDLASGLLRDAARIALDTVAAKRATFGHANVLAEVHRQLHGVRFATPADRLAIADRITTSAIDQALALTPAPDLAAVPEHLRRTDGSSKLQHRGVQRYTTQQVLDAETRLLDAGRSITGPAIAPTVIDEVLEETAADDLAGTQQRLGADQVAAVKQIAGSGRVLDVLVGPAGTGKTVSLAGLRDAWEDVYGPGSVIGLAPSAAAAEVLGDELGIDTDNTRSGCTKPRCSRNARPASTPSSTSCAPPPVARPPCSPSASTPELAQLEAEQVRWMIHPGQLVIIDEASLAGTLHLDQIVAAGCRRRRQGRARRRPGCSCPRSKPAARSRCSSPTATTRPNSPTSAASPTRGNATPACSCASATRPRSTPTAPTTASRPASATTCSTPIYTAWREDTDRGLTSIMIAGDRDAVAELNLRARTDRVLAGHVHPAGVDIAGDASRRGR